MRRLPRLPQVVVALAMSAATQPMARAGTVLHVDDDAPPGGDGSTWRAAADLESALAIAAEVGSGISEIRVAAGVYRPTHRTDAADYRSVTFGLVDGVALRGGYAGLSGPDPDQRDIDLYETILAGTTGYVVTDCCVVHQTGGCDQKECAAAVCETLPECCDPAGSWDQACVDAAHPLCGCAPSFVNSYHVITAQGLGSGTELDGFTISGGNTLFGDPGVVTSGAGLYGVDSSPTVRRCTFLGNTAASGGAMAAFGGAPVVIECVFSANFGGAVLISGSNATVTSCAFLANPYASHDAAPPGWPMSRALSTSGRASSPATALA